MSDEKYKCPVEGCTREFFTATGLDVHMASHEVKKPKPKEVVKEAPPKPKVEKKASSRVRAAAGLPPAKVVPFDYKARLKKMRSKLEAKVGQKYSKSDLLHSLSLDEKSSVASRIKGRKYEITEVREMKNGWYMITALSTKDVVRWREGPIKGKWRVTIPMLR